MKKYYEIMVDGEKYDAENTVKRIALKEAKLVAREHPESCVEIYQVNVDDEYIPGTPVIIVQDFGCRI